MPFRLRAEPLRTAKALLERRGHRCALLPWDSASTLRERVRTGGYDMLLCAEASVLPRRELPIRAAYLAPGFFCAERFPPGGVSLCLIPHELLTFDFITHGVRDKDVRVCGVPLPDAYRIEYPRKECCAALGLREEKPIFLVCGDAVSLSVLKSFVSAAQHFCEASQILLLGSGEVRRNGWMRAFSARENVFVSDTETSFSLGLGAAQAVFTPAFAPTVCAAARQGKPLALLHTAVPRGAKNAAFLAENGAAFLGRSTADSVSYLCRLLDSDRLCANMRASQEKLIVPDAEDRLFSILEA